MITALRRFRQAGTKREPLWTRLVRFKVAATVAAVVLAATVVAVILLTMAVVITAPAAVPVAIAGKVLSGVSDLFGGESSGEITAQKLDEVGRDADLTCRPVPTAQLPSSAAGAPPPPPEHPDPDSGDQTDAGSGENAPETQLEPIVVRPDGSLDRHDAQSLVDPVPPHTSALTAHVWFLYRLAGLGDWDGFVAAYRQAGLDEADRASNAPLAQVQRLNPAGVNIEPYRLTAASLASAGLETGRYAQPYDGYRELLSTELMTSCLKDTGLETKRMTLPTPVTVTSPAPEHAPGDAHLDMPQGEEG